VISSSVYPDGVTPVTTTTLLDGLGRKSVVTNPDGATSEIVYDPLGHVASVSNFHTSTSSSTDGSVSNTYDALGRPGVRPAIRIMGQCPAMQTGVELQEFCLQRWRQ